MMQSNWIFNSPAIPAAAIALLMGIPLIPSKANATTIVDYTFDHTGDTAWPRQAWGTDSLVDDSAGLGTGMALSMQATATFPAVWSPTFTTQSLAAGQSITLSFDMRFIAAPVNTGAGFRFALENYGNSSYTFQGGVSASGGSQSKTFIYFPIDYIAGGNGTSITTSGPSGSISGQGVHHMSLTASVFADRVDLMANYDGSIYTASDSSATRFTSFNEVEIGEGNMQTSYNIDNVVVSTGVALPEPSTCLTFTFGATTLVGLLRKRRRR